jgi:hypothetical protein
MEWLTLLAIVLGPILAVQAEKWIERLREETRERKLVFLTLMRTRNNILSREHVDALNMIPLVFRKKNLRDTEVRRRWDILLTHRLSAFPSDKSEAVRLDFIREGINHLTDLLISLATALNYKLDKNDIQKVYSPQAYEKELAENQEARHLLLQLLRGKSVLKIQETPEKQD